MGTKFDSTLQQLTKEMLLIMYATQGVGLAAPQVGINQRLMVFNPKGDSKNWLQEVILCNPKIVSRSKLKATGTEGCLSFPDPEADQKPFAGIPGNVTRNK